MPAINTVNDRPGEKKGLSESVALVTGGSRGIGRAIAYRLGTLGAAVAICGRDRAALENSAAALEKLGGRTLFQVTDVTNAKQVSELASKTEAALGPISILVNNAGVGLFGPAHEKTEADWDRVLGFAGGSAFDGAARFWGHHQHQLPGGQKHLCWRRALLRFQMGPAGLVRLHDGGFA